MPRKRKHPCGGGGVDAGVQTSTLSCCSMAQDSVKDLENQQEGAVPGPSCDPSPTYLPFREALALAVVRSRKERQRGELEWKQKALEQQRQFKRLEIALEQLRLASKLDLVGIEDLLRSLPDPEKDVKELPHEDMHVEPLLVDRLHSCNEMQKGAAALGQFLRNVQSVNFVHRLKDGGDPCDSSHEHGILPVVTFVKTTLANMPSSSLRRAYSKRSAEFLEWKVGLQSGGERQECSSYLQASEHIGQLIDDLLAQDLGRTEDGDVCRGEAYLEHLMFLTDGQECCGEVLKRATSAIRAAVQNLASISKGNSIRSDEQLDNDSLQIITSATRIFENSLPLLLLQEKALDVFTHTLQSCEDHSGTRISVLEQVISDIMMIHDDACAIQTFLPLLFKRVNQTVATTVSLLQHLATCEPTKSTTTAPNSTKAKCRSLCNKVYGRLVPNRSHMSDIQRN